MRIEKLNNYILANRSELSKTNYIRIATPKTDYWVGFASKKLNEYRNKFGENFNLIIVGDKNKEGEFYVLPFFAVDHLFDEKYLYHEPVVRWVASIKYHQLRVRQCPIDLDISKYYGSIDHVLYSRKLLSINRDENDYAIENRKIEINARQKQSKFRNKVLSNYSGKCCLSGITEQDLLIASHIIPWAERIDTRLDPSNGICLFTLYDKLFDEGYFSFDDNLSVVLTNTLPNLSKELLKFLSTINRKKMTDPIYVPINLEYIRYHRLNIFKG